MGRGSGQGGTSDPTYDLISVMYHALQGCETYERYAQDAEQGGQQDLAQYTSKARAFAAAAAKVGSKECAGTA